MSPDAALELHIHCQALRQLARALVGEAHADDLVQDTALAALQLPARPRSLSGWLANSVRYLAHKQRRTERRRLQREQQAARAEAVPAGDREVEAGDTLRFLTDHVLALPQPYREVVLLRYLRELTPKAIARRTGAPLATIKSQLQRGLGLLQKRLDQHDRDWRAGLCLACGIGRTMPTAVTSSITTGVLFMGSTAKLATGLGAAVLALAAALFFLAGDPAAPVAPVTSASEPGPLAAALPPPAAAPTGATDHGADRTAARELAQLSAGPFTTVRGRCVDMAGLPLADVKANLTGQHGNAEEQRKQLYAIDLTAVTGADGAFAFRFEPQPPLHFGLLLRADGRADLSAQWQRLDAGADVDVGDVRMLPGVTVRGSVVDTNGAAVARASLNLRRNEPQVLVHAALYHGAQTGKDGRFAVHRVLTEGEWQVDLGESREVIEGGKMQFTAPAAELRIVVRAIDPSRTIAGLVLDERGEAVANAQVGQAGDRPGFSVLTDAGGRFELLRRKDQPDDAAALIVEEPGFDVLRTTLPWGTRDARLTLTPVAGQSIHVVRSEDGTPLEDYRLYVVRESQPGEATTIRGDGLRSSGKHPLGRTDLRLPSGRYLVIVQPDDASLAMSEPVPLEVTASGASAVVRIGAKVARLVRLQTQSGKPVAGATARLSAPPLSPRTVGQFTMLELPGWIRSTWQFHGLLLDEGSTDANGEVRLHGRREEPFLLFLPGPGHAPQTITGVRLDEPEPLIVTVTVGATLRGVCVPAGALAALGEGNTPMDPDWARKAAPALKLFDREGAKYFPAGQDPAIAIGADGSFMFEHAPPGAWRLQFFITWSMGSGFSGRYIDVDRVVLREGETTEVRVDLSPFQSGEIEGVVLHNGEPLAGVQVAPVPVITPGATDVWKGTATVKTDAEGRFRCRRFHGPFRLEWHQRGFEYRSALRADETVTVLPGQSVAQTFHIHTGAVRVTLLDAAGKPVPKVTLQLRGIDGERRFDLPATDAAGVAELLVDAGTFHCKTLPASLRDPKAQQQVWRDHPGHPDPFAASLVMLDTLTVREGSTTEVELRLPAEQTR